MSVRVPDHVVQDAHLLEGRRELLVLLLAQQILVVFPPGEDRVGTLKTVDEELEAALLRLHLHPSAAPRVEEGGRGQLDDPRLWHDSQLHPGIDDARPGLGEVARVGDEAGPPETTETQHPLEELRPLGVQRGERLLVLRLEDGQVAAVEVSHKIRARAALRDEFRQDPARNGILSTAEYTVEFRVLFTSKTRR